MLSVFLLKSCSVQRQQQGFQFGWIQITCGWSVGLNVWWDRRQVHVDGQMFEGERETGEKFIAVTRSLVTARKLDERWREVEKMGPGIMKKGVRGIVLCDDR